MHNLSQVPEDEVLKLTTNKPRKNGSAGVMSCKLIRLHMQCKFCAHFLSQFI